MAKDFDYNNGFPSIFGIVTACFVGLTLFFVLVPINYSSLASKIAIIAVCTFVILYVIIRYIIYKGFIGGNNYDGAIVYIFWITTVPILFTAIVLIMSQENQKIIGIFENTLGYLFCKMVFKEKLNELFQINKEGVPEDYKEKYEINKTSLLTLFNYVRKFKRVYKHYINYVDQPVDGENTGVKSGNPTSKDHNKYSFYIQMAKKYEDDYAPDSGDEEEEEKEEEKKEEEEQDEEEAFNKKQEENAEFKKKYYVSRWFLGKSGIAALEKAYNTGVDFSEVNKNKFKKKTPIKELFNIVGYKNTIGICSWFFISSLFASMVSVKILTKI
jgi:hypothetical protein